MFDRSVVQLGCSFISLLGVERWLLRRLRGLDAAVILNLHRVTPRPNPYWPGLHPRTLDEVLRYASRAFEVVTIGELGRDAGRGIRRRPRLALSFDDGYHDFLEYAAPVLDKYGVRVNQNVITGCVAGGVPPWNVLIYDFLAGAPTSSFREMSVPGFPRPVPRSAASQGSYGVALSRYLKMRPRAERDQLAQSLRNAMDRVDFPRTRMLRASEVVELARRHEVGSHSHSHESMGYEGDDFFRDDFAASRSFFEGTLGIPLRIYAFPNGSCRPEQIGYLLEQGVGHVLLVGERLVRPLSSRVLPRITFHAGSAAEARLRCCGWSPRGLARPQAEPGMQV